MAEINELKDRLMTLQQRLPLTQMTGQIKELEAEAADASFWQNQEKAMAKMKMLARLQKELDDLKLVEKLIEENNSQEAEAQLDKLELKLYLSGPYDPQPALLSVHAGQGGVEAMDWAQMLERMYIKYIQKKDWSHSVLEETPGEEAGIKKAVIAIDEPYAYGYLKFEAGTHRLVRQSPFNADQLRQTSFALVEVLPQIGETEEAEIKEEDLDWQFYRASSQGGQNVQKVSSAVRLIHRPSGVVVTCEQERTQEQNRKIALKLLGAKLWQKHEEERQTTLEKLKGGRTKAAWGTQIRSYVLHPYKMVKDLRTETETADSDAVLDGDIDEFIQAEVQRLSSLK